MKSTYDLYWDDKPNPSITLTEYMRLYIINLEHDLEPYASEDSFEYKLIQAQIHTAEHLLSAANAIFDRTTKGE